MSVVGVTDRIRLSWGYERYDARLCHLGPLLVQPLTSVKLRREVALRRSRLPPSQPVPSRLVYKLVYGSASLPAGASDP